MKCMKMAKSFVSNKYAQAGALLTASFSSFAADPVSNADAIKSAVSAGKNLVSLTTTGVIGISALGFGVGMVVMWLARR